MNGLLSPLRFPLSVLSPLPSHWSSRMTRAQMPNHTTNTHPPIFDGDDDSSNTPGQSSFVLSGIWHLWNIHILSNLPVEIGYAKWIITALITPQVVGHTFALCTHTYCSHIVWAGGLSSKHALWIFIPLTAGWPFHKYACTTSDSHSTLPPHTGRNGAMAWSICSH